MIIAMKPRTCNFYLAEDETSSSRNVLQMILVEYLIYHNRICLDVYTSVSVSVSVSLTNIPKYISIQLLTLPKLN